MCFTAKRRKRINKKEYLWKPNKVHPLAKEKVNGEFIEKMSKEHLRCNHCDQKFTLRSEEIKIHCAGCDKFYHCGIAGECIGDGCTSRLGNGMIHRLRYCNSCAKEVYSDGTCLCSTCSK